MPATSAYGALRISVALAAFFVMQGAAFAETPSIQTPSPRAAPTNVILDMDIWSDIDDMLALAMLHALHERHEVKLVAVTISTDDPWCASCVDLVDTFYEHSGIVRDGMTFERFREKFPPATAWPVTRYTEIISQRKMPDGSLVYPHRLTDGTKAPEAVSLLRNYVARAPRRTQATGLNLHWE
jgi:hypothetical protein